MPHARHPFLGHAAVQQGLAGTLKACRRLSPSAPTIQTIGSECPSVVVTIGDPAPGTAPHHAVVNDGRSPPTTLSTVSSPVGWPAGQLDPGAWKATKTEPPTG